MAFIKLETFQFKDVHTILETRLPRSAMPYNFLQMQMNGMVSSNVIPSFYAYNGILNDEIFFVIIINREATIYEDNAVIVSTPRIITDEMKSAFEKLVPWENKLFFCAVDVSFSATVIELCKLHDIFKVARKCDFMVMSLEETKGIQISEQVGEGVKVSELRKEDAEFVVDNWQYARKGSASHLAEDYLAAGSGGVYVDGQIVSCVCVTGMGSINALFTSESERGKGYGGLTMKKVCQVAGSKGLLPNVQVEIGNDTSKNLMLKMGFKTSHQIEWVWCN